MFHVIAWHTCLYFSVGYSRISFIWKNKYIYKTFCFLTCYEKCTTTMGGGIDFFLHVSQSPYNKHAKNSNFHSYCIDMWLNAKMGNYFFLIGKLKSCKVFAGYGSVHICTKLRTPWTRKVIFRSKLSSTPKVMASGI